MICRPTGDLFRLTRPKPAHILRVIVVTSSPLAIMVSGSAVGVTAGCDGEGKSLEMALQGIRG